jgi:hypothetical protein
MAIVTPARRATTICSAEKEERTMTDWRKFDEPTPRTFVSEAIVDGVVDFVVVEAVETAQERARRKWGMKDDEEA